MWLFLVLFHVLDFCFVNCQCATMFSLHYVTKLSLKVVWCESRETNNASFLKKRPKMPKRNVFILSAKLHMGACKVVRTRRNVCSHLYCSFLAYIVNHIVNCGRFVCLHTCLKPNLPFANKRNYFLCGVLYMCASKCNFKHHTSLNRLYT